MEEGGSSEGLFEAVQKRLLMCNQSPGLAAAFTIILPPRPIAGR
jgi:hypothetical protein